jgi:hypothetical protein
VAVSARRWAAVRRRGAPFHPITLEPDTLPEGLLAAHLDKALTQEQGQTEQAGLRVYQRPEAGAGTATRACLSNAVAMPRPACAGAT